MGRFLPLRQRTVVLPAALLVLTLGAAVQSQTMSPPGPRSTGELHRRDDPSSAPAPAPAPIPNLKRYKVRLFSCSGPGFESWIVFDVSGDTTIILLKHATTNTAKWWDHPVLSSKACRIIQVEGGDRLVDCQRAARSGSREHLRIVLPQGLSLQNYLFTFTWQESGRIQEGLLRIERGLIPDVLRSGQTQKPDVIAPVRVQPMAADSRGWRYKVKLSQGVASQNIAPESWVVFDVIGGTTVTLKHTTNSVNILTGLSRWWDHPVLSSMACPLFQADGRDRLSGCLRGSSAGPGQHQRIVLPEGASLHDYRFTFTWREHSRIQEGVTSVDRMVKPTPIPPR